MWRNILCALFFLKLSGNHSISFVPFCIAVNIAAVIALLLVPAATISILLTLLSWWHKTNPFFKHISTVTKQWGEEDRCCDQNPYNRYSTPDHMNGGALLSVQFQLKCARAYNAVFCSQICLFSDSFIYWQQFSQSLLEKFNAVIFCIGFYWSNS